MLNKKLLCAALALMIGCSCTNQILGQVNGEQINGETKKKFLSVGKSKVTDKTITLKFFKEKQAITTNKTSKKQKQCYKQIALIRYSWTSDRTTIHLDLFKILSRKNRKKGLGKQLFTYFIKYIQKSERAAKTICWTAQTLDPEHMSQEKLETFYKSIGGTKLSRETYTNSDCTCESPRSSQFSLTINNFVPTDTSLLQTMNIIEEAYITRVKTLACSHEEK